MSEMAKSLRAKMKDKAKAMSSEKVGKVDSSDWTPAEPINAEVKTGMRPISRRAFKSGGKVSGEACEPRADRKPRKAGGEAKSYANAKVNRDVKSANEEREGVKHVGALKSGGRAKKLGGGGLMGILGGLGPAALAGAFDGKDEKKGLGLKKGGRANRANGGGFSTQKDSSEEMSAADQARAAAASKATSQKAQEEGAHGYKKGGRTAKNNGGGFSTQKDSSEDMSAADQARAAAASKAAADKAREEGAHGRKAGGRAARKDGGSINFGPAEMPAGKKGASEAQQRATESKQENLSKPSRGRAGHYADGGYMKFKGDPVIPGMKKGGKTQSGRMQRKAGGRTKGKTNINIMISTGKPQAPMGPDLGGPPPGPPGGIPVPMPPPGAGAPPPAMSGMPMMPPAPPMGGGLPPGIPPMARKSGGKVYRSYKDMDAGAGGGEGRLEKSEIQEHKRGERRAGGKVYRSYKDMDAGAGSGLGRLEKSEIQKRKH